MRHRDEERVPELWRRISATAAPSLTLPRKRGRGLRRRIAVGVVLLLLALGVAAGLKVYEYTAAPPGEKDCAANPRFAGPPTAPALQIVEPPIPLAQKGGTINDASCLNRTPVYGIAKPADEEALRKVVAFARDNGLKLSIAGARHSMGGQAFFTNALVINTGNLKQMSFDGTHQLLTVQAGATWHEVLAYLHPRGFSVKVMQAIDLPTVGGSISVNAHGVDHRAGSLASTVRSLSVMLSDGSVHQVSREREPELFASVMGGYGLFGIVLEAQLEVVPDVMYQYEQRTIDYQQFPQLFTQKLSQDPYRLMYGHLSTAPGSFLKEMLIYTYRQRLDESLVALRSHPVLPEFRQDGSPRARGEVVRREEDHAALSAVLRAAQPGAAGRKLPGIPKPGALRKPRRAQDEATGRYRNPAGILCSPGSLGAVHR